MRCLFLTSHKIINQKIKVMYEMKSFPISKTSTKTKIFIENER